MAITKIAKIKMTKDGKANAKARLKSQIEYIINGDKTEDGILVSSSMCSANTAVGEFMNTTNMINQRNGSVMAYHLKQSFKPGEVSPDEAHQIGIEFAEKVLGGNFQYVIATHTDKEHIHNHIVFCATSPVTKTKYNDCNKERYRRERISDQICMEHGLSVIREKSGKKGWRVWESEQIQKSGKRKIIQSMAEVCMRNSASIPEFILQMERAGCKVIEENGKLAFKLNGSGKYMHENSFYVYDENTGDKILDFRCSYKGLSSHFDRSRKVKKFEVTGERKILLYQVRDGVENKRAESDKTSIEKMIKTLNYLEENKVETDTDFVALEEFYKARYEDARNVFSEKNDELKMLSMKINYAKHYWKFKKIYEASLKENENFSQEHSADILKFIKAQAFFESVGMEEKDLGVKRMIAEWQDKKHDLEALKKHLDQRKNDYKKILAVKMNCEMIINRKIAKAYDSESEKKQPNKTRDNSKKDI